MHNISIRFRVSQPKNVQLAISTLRELLIKISVNKHSELWRIVRKLGFADLNRALYKCDQEERDDGKGFDVYNIPNYGSLVYAGLQGNFVALRLFFVQFLILYNLAQVLCPYWQISGQIMILDIRCVVI